MTTQRLKKGGAAKADAAKSVAAVVQTEAEEFVDDERDLYLGIREMRRIAQKRAMAKVATRDEIYRYRDFCKLEIEARRNLDLSRDNLETFVAGYEKLIEWLAEIAPQVAGQLTKHGERLTAMAQAHYSNDGSNNHNNSGKNSNRTSGTGSKSRITSESSGAGGNGEHGVKSKETGKRRAGVRKDEGGAPARESQNRKRRGG